MIYLVALVLSVALCAQAVASAATAGAITHLKHGREPSTGVSLFPMVPLLQLFALGAAWILEQVAPRYAIWVLVALLAIAFVIWLASFEKLRAALQRAKTVAGRHASAWRSLPSGRYQNFHQGFGVSASAMVTRPIFVPAGSPLVC
jgi:hypothetical protein